MEDFQKEHPQTYAFTDGASKGNPGPAGWGAVIIQASQNIIELGGRSESATNNQMELTAAIKTLEFFALNQKDFRVTLFSDSKYVVNGATSWIKQWKENGWKTRSNETVLNINLWQQIDFFSNQINTVNWQHVPAHQGIIGNERADTIASGFALGARIDLYSGPINEYTYGKLIPPNSGCQDIQAIATKAMNLKKSKNASSQSRSRAKRKAHSYISLVDGILKTHSSWDLCEARVKGRSKARFKKALSPQEEAEIIKEFTGQVRR